MSDGRACAGRGAEFPTDAPWRRGLADRDPDRRVAFDLDPIRLASRRSQRAPVRDLFKRSVNVHTGIRRSGSILAPVAGPEADRRLSMSERLAALHELCKQAAAIEEAAGRAQGPRGPGEPAGARLGGRPRDYFFTRNAPRMNGWIRQKYV